MTGRRCETWEQIEAAVHAATAYWNAHRHPFRWGCLPFSTWTLQRLADELAERTGIRVRKETVRVHLQAAEIVLRRPQPTISTPDPEYAVKKRRLKMPATS